MDFKNMDRKGRYIILINNYEFLKSIIKSEMFKRDVSPFVSDKNKNELAIDDFRSFYSECKFYYSIKNKSIL